MASLRPACETGAPFASPRVARLGAGLIVLVVLVEEPKLNLIVVCWLSPMDFRMALPTYREQVARQLLKYADISEVMNFARWPLAALFASVVGAPQDVFAPLAPEGLAEIPVIRGEAIVG